MTPPWTYISAATAAVVEDKIDETRDRLQRETKALLREHWPAVKRVAKALFVRDRLDHAEVERLIAGRTQMAPPRPRLAPRGNHSPGDERVRPRYRRLGCCFSAKTQR
jgi:hypothetical protein